ncbi:MAG: hypothetical protein E2O42_00600 [Nitrospina sp.]|nr:MAG: hypothetical protein E2O42_00600 [Nitrospina sp.]
MHSISKAGGSFVLAVLLLNSLFSNTLLAQDKNGKPEKVEEKNGLLGTFSNNPVVAVADGQLIHLDDLKNAQIHELMVRLYQMQSAQLKQKVVNSLSQAHPELKSQAAQRIKKEDIEYFYLNEPGIRDLGDLDQLRGQIRNYLEKLRRQGYFEVLEKRYQMAVDNGWVKDYLKPPNDFRLQVRVGSAMLWFNGKDAKKRKVFVMEYSDFLCPFCRKVQGTLRDLRKKYPETVQFGYRHFPIHQEARDLSEAVECARDQGRFWELQSLVYLDPKRLQQSKRELLKYVKRAGVRDLHSFEQCLDSGKYQKRVEKDMKEGVSLGIQGTPTFIIGIYNHSNATIHGEMFSGAVPPAKFINLIEKYLNPLQK